MTEEMKTCPYCGEEILAVAKKCRFCGKWLNKENNSQSVNEENDNMQNMSANKEETIACPVCGEEILKGAKKCKHCGEWLNGNVQTTPVTNNKELPAEYKKFNWGAFLLSWIWGIGNKTYIALLMLVANLISFIPFVGWLAPLAFAIWLGIKGNELAWQNNEWRNLEEFTEIQRKWAMWGIIVISALIILTIIVTIILAAAGVALFSNGYGY